MQKDIALLIMRFGFGATMLFGHGMGKLTGFAEKSAVFPDPFGLGSTLSLGLAVFAEVFCAAAVMLGLWTRLASIPLVATMAVAVFMFHAADPFAKKELALLYLFGFLALALLNGGRFSLDKVRIGVKR